MKSASKVQKIKVNTSLFTGLREKVKVVSKKPRCGLCGRKVRDQYICEYCDERI